MIFPDRMKINLIFYEILAFRGKLSEFSVFQHPSDLKYTVKHLVYRPQPFKFLFSYDDSIHRVTQATLGWYQSFSNSTETYISTIQFQFCQISLVYFGAKKKNVWLLCVFVSRNQMQCAEVLFVYFIQSHPLHIQFVRWKTPLNDLWIRFLFFVQRKNRCNVYTRVKCKHVLQMKQLK